jgi:Transmembrane secretion effector
MTSSPLRSTRVRRIVCAYTVNRLGTWFGLIALAVAVFDDTGSALAVSGLLLSAQVLPAFLVPALVARVETSTRRGALSRLYLFEALATAALAGIVLWRFTLPAVLLLVALDGTAALAASALLRAAAARAARDFAYEDWDRRGLSLSAPDPALDGPLPPPQTYAAGAGAPPGAPAVEDPSCSSRPDDGRGGRAGAEEPVPPAPDQAREASAMEAERRTNAALNIGFAITFTFGPALAGLVVPAFGAPVALLIDTASFAICACLLFDLQPSAEDSESPSMRARLQASWSYINDTRILRALLLTQTVAFFFFEFSPPIEVVYAKVSLHAGDSGYGVLLGVWGLGVAIGSVVFARSIKRSLGVLLSASTLAVGVAYLGWAAAPNLGVACAAGLIGGVGNGIQWAALISAVQGLTPQKLHGQLMGAVESIGAIGPALGFAVGGAITAASSARSAFLVAGIGATLCTLAFARLPLGKLTSASKGVEEQREWEPEPSPSNASVAP